MTEQPDTSLPARILRAVILTWSVAVAIVPILFLALNSFKLPRDYLAVPPRLIPSDLTLEHYDQALTDPEVSKFFTNSLTITSITTIVTVIVSTLAAYGLSRMGLRSRTLGAIVFMFLFIRFYPRITTVIPFFIIIRDLNLIDTVWAIILGHLSITVPFATWLLLIMFNDLPKEVEEAGIVDGAGPMRRLVSLLLPLAAPGIASAAILSAFLSWNEFLIASSLARSDAATLSIGVSEFVTDRGILWGPMSALATLMIVPMVIIALTLQRYLVQGLTFGAVKG